MPDGRGNNRSLATVWERIDRPNTEERIMSAFEMLFSDPIKSAAGFDKQPKSSQDEK
jgi:hypothetical protein